MKSTSGVLILLVIAAVSAEWSSDDLPTAFRYHERIGIPKAAEIKKWEEENAGKNTERIVGGWNVDISQVPYQAGLVLQLNWFWQSVCGASLISNNRLLTAAHCCNDGSWVATSFTVVLGSNLIYSGGLRVVTTDSVLHPAWNHRTLENDIAILRTSTITFTNVIQAIALPFNDVSTDFSGWTSTASGWGYTQNNGNIPVTQRLSAVTLPILNNLPCQQFYGTWYRASNICTSGAGGRGTCHGDSGGPLAVTINNRPTLVGVTSYGSRNGCQAGDPAVFARVTSFLSWISSI